MQQQLVKVYLRLHVSGLTGFLMLYLLNHAGLPVTINLQSKILIAVLVVLAAVSALVAPLWYRIAFVRKQKNRTEVPQNVFMRFQKNFIRIGASTVYVLIVAYIFTLPGVPFLTIVLLLLYAMYFYFPSKKRIRAEKKLFRINERL